MARFLTTKHIAAGIDDIIKESITLIIVVSPFLKLSQEYIERLQEAGDRNVSVLVIYGKQQSIDEATFKALKTVKNLELKFYEQLHAKCYINDTKAIITSMNLYDYSELNNREMGIMVTTEEDDLIYSQIKAEISSIQRNAKKIEMHTEIKPSKIEHPQSQNKLIEYQRKQKASGIVLGGYCIRCWTCIKLNPRAPLCSDCHSMWSVYKNHQYVEKYCHKCGRKKEEISFGVPLCETCQSELGISYDSNK